MSTKHTPGPWNAVRMLRTPADKDRRSGFVVNAGADDADGLNGRVCDLRAPQGMDGLSICEANARLIAAAPDLLAACEGMIQKWETLSSESANLMVRRDLDELARGALQLRAAIATARGTT